MSYDLPQQTPTPNQNPTQGTQTPLVTPPPAPVTTSSPAMDTFEPASPNRGEPASSSPNTPPPVADEAPLITDTPPPPVVAPIFPPTSSSPGLVATPIKPNESASAVSPEEVEKLTNQLLDDLGLSNLEGKDKEEIISAIRERVNNTILLTLLESLNEQDADELEEKLKAGASDEEALELLAGKAINNPDKFSAALANLYNELKETLK